MPHRKIHSNPHSAKEHAHPARWSGKALICTDRRVKEFFIYNAMKKARVPEQIIYSFLGSYAHKSPGNLYDPWEIRAKGELGYHREHTGTHFSVIGHDEVCGGMKLLGNALRLKEEGGNYKKLYRDRDFGGTYREVTRAIKDYDSFLDFVKNAHKKNFLEFLQTDKFRQALEEFNVFLQFRRALDDPRFMMHDETAKRVHGKGIIFVGGIYTPKEKLVAGKLLPTQGSIRFEYPHLTDAIGSASKFDQLTRELGLSHKPGSPIIERVEK